MPLVSYDKKDFTRIVSRMFQSSHVPVRKGRSSVRVLSTPNAKAIVDNFLMLFRRSCKIHTSERKARLVVALINKPLTYRAFEQRKFNILRLLLNKSPDNLCACS